MKTNGEDFMQSKPELRPGSFDYKFHDASSELALDCKLNVTELMLLRRAAFHAALCNISFNGLGGCGGEIKPHRENHRRQLECKLMDAREALCSSHGWKRLSSPTKAEINRRLLTVRIAKTNLAW
jgi:hypothetical protein